MSDRAAWSFIAAALLGVIITICIAMGSVQLFPKSLLSEQGECPAHRDEPAVRGPVLDQWTADWYSSELVPFDEKPIFRDKDQPQQVIRFTYQRSFDATVMVRAIETPDGRTRLIAKRMPGTDGCDDAKTQCLIDRFLTPEEQARLTAAKASMLRKASYGCPTGVDGTMWIIEASGRGDYSFWSEWSPRSGDLHDLGLVMLDLTGWRLRYIY